MITQVIPIKVPEAWFIAKPGIITTANKFGVRAEQASAELLKRCCAGTMQLWIVADGDGVAGFFITEISLNEISSERALNIYILVLYKNAPPEIIEEGKTAINTFARGNKCSLITFTTYTPQMATLAEKWWPGWKVLPTLRRTVQ